MPYESCQRRDCASPSEFVVVVVTVSLRAAADEPPPERVALCAGHAAELALLVRHSGDC